MDRHVGLKSPVEDLVFALQPLPSTDEREALCNTSRLLGFFYPVENFMQIQFIYTLWSFLRVPSGRLHADPVHTYLMKSSKGSLYSLTRVTQRIRVSASSGPLRLHNPELRPVGRLHADPVHIHLMKSSEGPLLQSGKCCTEGLRLDVQNRFFL